MKSKLLIGLCAVLSLTSIATQGANTEEAKQLITRKFTVSDPATLEINNTFGNVVIAQGDPSVIDFRIEITGTGPDQKTAQRMAERASVSLNQSGNTVTAKTSLSNTNENCNNCGVSINYLVVVPASVYMDLTNKFGNIDINADTRLDFKANLQYGNLTTRNLQGSNNNVTVKFGNMNIGDATSLTAECAYGKASVKGSRSLNMNVSFGGLTGSNINQLTLSTKYSDINVENLGSLTGSAEFSNFKIANLTHRFDLSSIKYGGVRIDNCASQLESIRIKASFCDVSAGLSPQLSAQVKLYTRFGNIKISGLNASSTSIGDDKDKFAKSFNGTIGSPGSNPAVIEISNSYANITLKP